jgi:arylsulfatase A-like enzyme
VNKLQTNIILYITVVTCCFTGLTQAKLSKKKKCDLLKRAIFLQNNEIAKLSHEYRELLFELHQNSHSITMEIPTTQTMLDTAFGIDPLIRDMFSGNVNFTISIFLAGEKHKAIFQKTLRLSKLSDEDFLWYDVNIDLSEYKGEKVTLVFSKDYKKNWIRKPKKIFDLEPIDYLLWAQPKLRPISPEGKYNVILISIDALRADHLRYMGYKRHTSPHIDDFATKGAIFTNTISQAPWTTPSHISMFTSTYPRIHKGNQPITVKNRKWNRKLPTLASILRNNGYLTAAFTGSGSISASYGLSKGFDFYNESGEERVELVYMKAIDWIKKNRGKRFFLFFHTYEVHSPYTYDYFLKRENITEKDPIKYRTALYDGDIFHTDQYMGKFFKDLATLDLLNKTLIILTSDHGDDLGGREPPESSVPFGHGHNLYHELLHVPLIFVGPRIIPQTINYQVRSIDIAPTVLEYLMIESPQSFQGSSLISMINGKDHKSRIAFSEATTYGTERESISFEGYKYIRRLSYGTLADCPGMELTPLDELYDLTKDPGELNNIANENEGIVGKYRSLINNLFENIPDSSSEFAPEIDISTDPDLMKSLRSLGYIQ